GGVRTGSLRTWWPWRSGDAVDRASPKHRPGLRGVVLQVGGPRPQRAVEARDTPVLRGWSLDRRGTNRPVRTAAYRSPLLRRTHAGRLREPFLPLRPEPPKCRQYTAPWERSISANTAS